MPDAAGADAAPAAEHIPVAPVEVVAPIAESLMKELSAVRHALDAELVLCGVFGVVRQGIEGDEEERELALTTVLLQVLGYAEAQQSEPSLALARVCGALGPATSRAVARGMAERLALAGVADKPWVRQLGRPPALRAWRYGDVLGEQESLGVLFSYRGRDHALVVLVDHVLGGGLKDVWVAEGRDATNLRNDVAAHVAADHAVTLADVDIATAAHVLRAAVGRPVVPAANDQVEDVAGLFHLALARAEHLCELSGLPLPDLRA